MQNGFVNPVLQLYQTKWTSDLIDENMLANALVTRPHEVSTVVSYLMGQHKRANLDFLTGGLGRKIVITNRQFEWPVMIDAERAVTITKAVWNGTLITTSNATSASVTPGLGGSTITLWLTDKWFGPGAVLVFDDRDYMVRVEGTPYQDGAEWVYTVRILNSQAVSYVPGKYLLPGCQVSRNSSAYEEYSEEADIVNYSLPFKLRNHLTTLRLSYDCTGDAYSSVMVMQIKDPRTNKSTNLWTNYQEWVAVQQFESMIEHALVYNKYNANPDGTTSLKGTNGRPVYVGAGLLEQIAPANVRYYTKLTCELLEDFLADLSYNLLPTNERKFVAMTGEMGIREFNRILTEKAASYNLIDTKFVTGSGQNLTLGGQFTTYKMTNGIELTLVHQPLYDNVVDNRKLHPVSGKPISSYRMTFLDTSSHDGEPNIVKVVRKDREMVMWYTGGSVSPSDGHAKSRGTLRSNAKDGYSVHFLSEVGIMLKNPTSCGCLEMDCED